MAARPAPLSVWLAVAGRVGARPPTAADEGEYLARVHASADLHRGWVARPSTPQAFAALLQRSSQDGVHSYLLARSEDGALVGAADLTLLDDRPLAAWIAFHAFVPYDGQGYMTDGLRAVLRHAFGTLRLQRVEASVQPENARSRALLARVGFRHEHDLPRHVQIDGAWRDHERWMVLADGPPDDEGRAFDTAHRK